MNLNTNESNIIPKFNYRDILIVLVPILIFILYLIVYNPGVLTASSYSQLHQIASSKFTTAHPIFHSLIEKLILKIFGTPFFIGLFQIIVFSAIWTVICKYHRDDTAKSSNEFVVQFIITLIICLIPINAVYSVSISSYVLFSYSIMFLCFLIKIMLDKNGQLDKKLIVLMALTIAIMSGLNNYGIVIALPTLIAIAYYLLKKDASENTFITFVGLAMLCIFIIASLNFVLDVKNDQSNISEDDTFGNDINLKGAQDQFFSTINGHPSHKYEKVTSVNEKQGSYGILDSYVDSWRGNFILNALFNNPILYMILSLLLLGLIYLKTGSTEIFLVYLAPLINTVIAILTGQPNIYSNMLVFYLIAIICVGFYFKPNLINDYSNRVPPISKPEIQTQPQFEAKENYVNDSYYSDLESEIADLTLYDINEMLRETPTEEHPKMKPATPQQGPVKEGQIEKPPEIEQTSPERGSDLVDEILKEIKMEKENK